MVRLIKAATRWTLRFADFDIAIDWKRKDRRFHEENGRWQTRDGDLVHVSKMTSSHLVNVYRMLRDKTRFDDGWQHPRSVGAYLTKGDLVFLQLKKHHPIVEHILCELSNREGFGFDRVEALKGEPRRYRQ